MARMERVLILLLLRACTASFAPDFTANATLVGERLRQDILSRPGFSRVMPPTSGREAVDYSAAGTDVFMQVRFFKVQSIAIAEGTMNLKVWMRMQWVDKRLAWDPEEYENVTFTYFQGHMYGGAEESEIWVPDVQHYNANQGLVNTLEPAPARVSYDGSVFYSRP
jgi:hypothetical protein